MAVDQIKKLQVAEDLLKQGRADEALAELQRLAEHSPNDLLTLNRMGDMLSRQGRVEDALGYYHEIADKFASAGYLHKAVAILKKMQRLDPDSNEILAMIGRLYIRQKLPVEGGRYLLTAADRFLGANEFVQARAVYEELVVMDPQNPLHRARLAETMAAEGDGESAGRELVRLADSLRAEGRWEDAERSYRRAGELCPQWHDPVLGVSACLTSQGKQDEALEILEAAVARGQVALLGELVLRSEMASRSERVDQLLRESSLKVASETYEHLFLYSQDRGEAAALWSRLDPVFATWPQAGAADRLIELYESLVGTEEGGHVPALERLYAVLEASPDRTAFVPAMERLYSGLRQKSMSQRAQAVFDWLRVAAPQSAVVRSSMAGIAAPPSAGAAPRFDGEAPPVPLSRTDKEFVTGRLTQAEILEKYSLVDQAVQQVRDIVTRFPGHVEAQKRMVKLLRQAGDKGGHAEALAGLAVACRAAGNVQAARNTAAEAVATKLLDASTMATLEAVGLIGEAAPAAQVPVASPPAADKAAVVPAVQAHRGASPALPAEGADASRAGSAAVTVAIGAPPDPAASAAKPVPPAAPPPRTAPVPAAEARPANADFELVLDLDGDDGIVLDLDSVEEAAAPPQPTLAPVPVATDALAGEAEPTDTGARAPGREAIEEIEFYLSQNRVEDARARLQALHAMGYASPRLAELAATVAKTETALSALPVPTSEPPLDPTPESVQDVPEVLGLLEADDDLSTIAAALESELDDELGPVEPDAGTEQSVEEVFAAFRERVNEEIGVGDHRTHYDLGIGYKEMGLLDEAIAEFEISSKCDELRHESQVMMGMIHRESGRVDEAVAAYRAAVAGSDPAQTVPLRYDLAELLQEAGQPEAALEVLREVVAVDPGYRDAQQRIASLETARPAGQPA